MKIILFDDNYIYIESNLNNYYYFNRYIFYNKNYNGNFVANFIPNKDYCNKNIYFYAVSFIIKNSYFIMLQYIPRISKFKYELFKEKVRHDNNMIRFGFDLRKLSKGLRRRLKKEYDIDYLYTEDLFNKLTNYGNIH
jgi:hypothetical protein